MQETEAGRTRAFQPARLDWRIAEVRSTHDETQRVRSLILDVPGWTGHLPGQHVDIRLTAEDGYQAQRSYSIASAPEDDGLMLTIERIAEGEVSPYLTEEARPGDRFELRGPIGGYFVWTAGMSSALLLIAGGSGIAPLMAMIRHRARAGSQVACTLLFSSRTYSDIIYRDELAELAEGDPNLSVIHTLTREQPLGWTGPRRRIDAEMLKALPIMSQQPLTFICGPTQMVESVSGLLLGLGHDPRKIRTERFGPTGG